MRFADERYVRVYTRDTGNWIRMPWEARALFMETLRKVDRAGVIDLDADEPIETLADMVRMPVDVVRQAMTHLERRGWVTLDGSRLSVPNFVEAQESRQSDAQRKRDQRERLNSQDKVEVGVTRGHTESHTVTSSHSVPSLAVPSVPSLPSHTESTQKPTILIHVDENPRFDFERLYRLYPRAEGKGDGMRRLEKQIRLEADYQRFEAAVRHYADLVRREGKKREHTLLWSTFCCSRWTDYVTATGVGAAAKPKPNRPPLVSELRDADGNPYRHPSDVKK